MEEDEQPRNQLYIEERLYCSVPLTRIFRDYLEPKFLENKDRGDGWNTEYAGIGREEPS